MKQKILLFLILLSYIAAYGKNNGNDHKGHINRDSTKTVSPTKTGNGSGSLGATPGFPMQNVCGLNYTSATVMTQTRSKSLGVNTNGTGFPTTLTISGLPCAGPILQAYAYWDASYTEAAAPNTSIVITNPAGTVGTYTAVTIGTGGTTGWSNPSTGATEDNAAYRADITAAVNVAGNGNFKINLNGFGNKDYEVDGVTIIIIYTDPKATYSGSIAMWDGLENNSSSLFPPHDLSATYTGFTVCAATTNTSAFVAIGDAVYGTNNPSQTKNDLNGVYGTFPEGFWQLNIINNVALTNGQTSTTDAVYTNDDTVGSTGSELDNFVWIVNGLYWQNTTCVTCTPIPLSATITATNAACAANDGTATVTATGGITAYTYSWAPGGKTTTSISGLGVGSYTVTVTDACGDVTTASINISQPNPVAIAVGIPTEVSCNGGKNGIETVTGGGGNAPYTYSWNPSGQTTSTATGLSAGTYTVTVTNSAGCSSTTKVIITQPSPITTTTSATPASCNLSNGSATVTASGGTSPYTYLWNPSGETTATATGIPIGTYTVTVTTSTGCTTTTTVTVTEPSAVTAIISATTPVSCNGGTNGTATATATGGSSPYTYSWTPTGGNTNVANGLPAGTYTVTIHDKNGCVSTATTTITQPALLTVTTTMTQATCGSSNGSATATTTEGTPPYTYSWTPGGGNTATINNISAGTYTATVTDANHCVATSILIVTNIGGPVVTITASTNVFCNGANNGTATANVTGGSAPYTYAWSPIGGNNNVATGLTAGTYTVAVKDANGCTSAATVVITQPVAIATTTSATPASCNLSNGSATVNVSNGTTPYTYLWIPSGETTATATGIPIGTYTVTVTDHNGCSKTTSVTVTQPSAVTAYITATTPPGCFGGNNGTATANASGGLSPYTYAWSPIGGNNKVANGLSAGTYTLTATDNAGCISTTTAIVTQPTPVATTIGSVINVSCNGGNNGSAKAASSGGSPPYTYAWSPAGGNNATAVGLSAGTFTVNTTDKNGCTASATVTINQPLPLLTTTSFTPASCNLSNGSASVTVSNGTTPYTYLWIPSNQTTPTATGIPIGTYTVTLTDNNGCSTSNSVTVTQPSAVIASISNTTPVSCNGGNDGSATAAANGGTGPYTFLWEPGGNTNQMANGLDANSYTLLVTDANGCISSASTIVIQPAPLSVVITGPLYLCSGATGTLTATPTGGTAPYSYAWSQGSSSDTASVAPANATTYTVTVTDANGCKASNVFTVSIGSQLFVSTSGNASICIDNSATFCAYAAGGTGGNIFTWQPGNFSSPCISVSPSVTTTYTITLTDNCGASATATSTLRINPSPDVLFSSDINQGCTPLCIQFYDNSTIQTGTIASYNWQFGDGSSLSSQGAVHCYPDSGTYTVILTATSDSGCSTTLKQVNMIHAFAHPKAAFSFAPQPASILNPTILFTDQTTDPNGGITFWTWTYGDNLDSAGTTQNPTHTYQDTGMFCARLVVMDHKGCTDTTTNCLIIDPVYTLYIPDAFTPNGDGLNETFQAKGTYIRSFEMYIFDRWGEQLYHATDISRGWNGTVKGGSSISQEDVYVYRILVTDWQNHLHSYIGRVTLMK